MASPVSFGDVVAMSKIAWRVAHAFTKGRHSAPREFREVENQLYSLSAALAAFKDVCGGDVTVDPADLPARFRNGERDGLRTVTGILDNCRETLKHLEGIVDRYSIVAAGPKDKDPEESRLRRWSAELLKNYRKIEWTTQAGDLAALRSQLMVHTNSLDLVLGIIVSSRTSRIEDSLRESSSMMKEIYSWWAQNLKNTTTSPPRLPPERKPTEMEQTEMGLQGAVQPISFEIHVMENGAPQLLCAEARLHDGWAEPGSSQLFLCGCKRTAANPENGSAHPRVENIALSQLSFPFRQTGDAAVWTLFKALDRSTNEMVTVLIRNVAPADMCELEESFIRRLAHMQASAMLQQGISNMLVHVSPDGKHVRALNIQGDVKNLHKSIDAVAFRMGHRQLSKPNVEGLSLLNYQELGNALERYNDPSLAHAELWIYYAKENADEPADVTKSVVHLHHSTSIKTEENEARVVIQTVEFQSYIQDQQVHRLEKVDVVFHMTTLEAAKTLHQRLEDMRMELFITSLQSPRPDETVALHLQATEVECEVAAISDAELLITRSRDDGRHRLIVTSRNRCTVLTQVLPDTFFAPPPSQVPTFASPTWLIQLDASGRRRVYHYPNGFRFLRFRNTSAERMFELGRNALLQGALPVRELAVREKTEDQL